MLPSMYRALLQKYSMQFPRLEAIFLVVHESLLGFKVDSLTLCSKCRVMGNGNRGSSCSSIHSTRCVKTDPDLS